MVFYNIVHESMLCKLSLWVCKHSETLASSLGGSGIYQVISL